MVNQYNYSQRSIVKTILLLQFFLQYIQEFPSNGSGNHSMVHVCKAIDRSPSVHHSFRITYISGDAWSKQVSKPKRTSPLRLCHSHKIPVIVQYYSVTPP